MSTNIPIKLERDPIIEALFEIKFQASVSQVSTLLPGFIYPELGEGFESPERLLGFDIPPAIIQAQPDLKYQPSFRIKGKSFFILIGDSSLIISCQRPYVGWDSFKAIILKLLKKLEQTKLIKHVERYSVKYINLMREDDRAKQFRLLKFKAMLGDYDISEHQVVFQTEIIEDGLHNLVEIRSGALATFEDGKSESGLMLSVDVISFNVENFWSATEDSLEKIHNKEKALFYGLLTDEAINQCSPVWKAG